MSGAPSRRNTASRGYRVVSRQSEVDESLFGGSSRPSPGRSASQRKGGGSLAGFYSGESPSARSQSGRRRQPETMQVVTSDQIRTVRVPRKKEESASIVISYDDYERIKRNAVPRDGSDERAAARLRQTARQEQQQAAAARREHLNALDAERKARHEKLSDLDQEEQEREHEIRTHARLQMEEQEDEIKKLNEKILQAKCYAILDAQVAEKGEIRQLQREEQARLDEMMEIDRVKALREQAERDEAVRKTRFSGAAQIKTQILEREEQRMLEEEMKEQEVQAMLRQIKDMQVAEEQAVARKKEKAAKLLQEVAKVNDAAQVYKQQQLEAEREEDERIRQYALDKVAREEAEEQRKIAEKKARDIEAGRLLAQQERAMDTVRVVALQHPPPATHQPPPLCCRSRCAPLRRPHPACSAPPKTSCGRSGWPTTWSASAGRQSWKRSRRRRP